MPDDQTRSAATWARRLPRIAAIDPAEAERLLPEASGGPNLGDRDDLTFRVARRDGPRRPAPRAEAPRDDRRRRPENPAFARPALVPYGLGLIAADAGRRPTRPRPGALLDEAFAGLVELGRDGQRRIGPARVDPDGRRSCPTVERLDPDRLAERLWLAASCRPPRAAGALRRRTSPTMATLALLVSRYDRAMAEAIVAPALERLPGAARPDGRPRRYADAPGLRPPGRLRPPRDRRR